MTDTIVAVATAPGRGGVGIVRLSGPQAFEITERIAGEIPAPRQASLREFRDAVGEVIDRGLLLGFPAPQSYTGEDVAELQGHGGPVVLDLLVQAAVQHGARPARPGEFSERAFLNDRMDLAQAEAVADLVNAATTQAARAANRSLEGELSRRVSACVEELTQLRTFVEGALDFSDEDVDWLADDQLRGRLTALLDTLSELHAGAARGRRLREGLTVALAGRPNVGKSTLLNVLSGHDAAIVTDIPGTTRDVLRQDIEVDGLPLTIVDTAGLRDSDDTVERIGIDRAWAAMRDAEVALFVVDDRDGVTAEDENLMKRLPDDATTIVLHNKCDLSGRAPRRLDEAGRDTIRLCAKSGDGLDLLRQAIQEVAGLDAGAEGLFLARARHVDAIGRALAAARDADQRLREGATVELAAEELRLAQQALSEITGAFTPDDLLGRIFSEFCIGK